MADTPRRAPIMIEIAPGELLDNISIPEIELQRMTDRAKLANVRTELALLEEARDHNLPSSLRLGSLAKQLGEVDETPWDIEDGRRDEERREPFGASFIELARAVWNSDERAALKRETNVVLGSSIVEEKSCSDSGRSDEQRQRPDPAPGPS